MDCLIDTHILLWALSPKSSPLSTKTLEVLKDPSTQVYVSTASLFEIAVKASVGKLSLPNEFFDGFVGRGHTLLQISPTHAKRLTELPMHHRDPFDRILVAQASVEGLVLLTHDGALGAYQEAQVQIV